MLVSFKKYFSKKSTTKSGTKTNSVFFNSFNLRKILFAFFFAILLLTAPVKLFATHSMGADMTYVCLGNNTYRIRISFYRDCAGIPVQPVCRVDFSSVSCGLTDSIYLFPIPGTGQDITPICPTDTTTCHGGSYTGIQEWIFEGTVTLPASCTDWQLVYEQCCRNGAITNINQPLNEEILIFATLNSTICNNSPTFSNRPVPFVCMGQTFCFNHGAYDVDGDSLGYTLINPISYFGMPVNYFPPYSPSQPLNSVPAMTFDYITGDFCITPQSLEVTVMAVLVSEYRNGVLIGQVERDIQITVIPCTNNLPVLSGINGTNSFAATICADAPYCFNVLSNDPDIGQNVTVTWDHAIPAGSLSVAIAPHPTGTFCWTPTQADAGGTPHCFTATVTDDACPYFGSQVYSYCLTVLNVAVDAGPDQSVNCAGAATINATGTTAFGNLTYQWSNGPVTTSQNVGPGNYTVTATNGTCTATDAVLISPITGPIASFNAAPVCANDPVNFYDASSVTGGTITSWVWNFADGTTSSLQNPTHLYAAPGNYNSSLIVTSNNGCADTIYQFVTVNAFPVASFTASNVCLGINVNLVNTTPSAGISSYNWDFGNGTTSNVLSPSVNYVAPGNYTINLIVTDAVGCSDTVQQPITIYPIPVADFTNSPAVPCQGSLINFNDASSAGINSWNWDFGNSQTSSIQNPNNTFSPGTYNVLLTVTSTDGCIDSIIQSVTVNAPFTATIGPPLTICVGTPVLLSASGGINYLWSNGAVDSVFSVSPAATTTYVVNVTDAAGCLDTAQVTISVNPLPVVNAGSDSSICIGNSITLTASGNFLYAWNPTGLNTQSISVSPVINTDYIVTATDVNGCINSDTVTVSINPLLVVTPASQFICPGDSALLDAGYAGASFLWSTGETTQTISPAIAGNYSVTVTASSGCTGIGQATVTVGGILSVNSVTASLCNGQSAIFDAGNIGSTYSWSTGETTQTISVSTAGTFQVTVTGTDGCTLTFPSTLILNPLPNALFSNTPVCLYDSSVFINNSNVISGTINSYQWNFGDGQSSSLISPSHLYNSAGIYTVSLTLTSDSGCTGATTSNIIINSVPVSNFQAQPVCLGNSTNFVDLTAVTNDTLNSWSWIFGDGTSATGQNAVHYYSVDGTFNVQLIASTIHGCIDTTNNNIIVNPLPVANAGPDSSICSGTSITIGDTSQIGIVYLWTPNSDLNQTNLSTVLFTGSNTTLVPEYHGYMLTTTNQFGCINSDSVTISVRPVPIVTFTAPDPQCLTGNLFTFSPSGHIDAQSYLTWDFGNGSTPNNSLASFPLPVNYSSAGEHYVTLSYSYSGCQGIPSLDTVTVWEMPLTGFIPDPFEGCAPLKVQFYPTHPYIQYNFTWTVEGRILHDINPEWTFETPGRFPVTLTVSNENGCSADPVTISINVYPVPVATFTNTPEVTRLYESLVEFRNYSLNAVQYEWDFGDGGSASFTEGDHMYTDTGSFDISMIAISSFGCRDTTYGKVIVEDGFSFFVPNAVTPNGDGDNDTFQGYGTFIHKYEMWIYDRWGKVIYFTDDYNKPWDCRMESVVQNDTYVYRIKINDSRDKSHVYLGSVTVVK